MKQPEWHVSPGSLEDALKLHGAVFADGLGHAQVADEQIHRGTPDVFLVSASSGIPVGYGIFFVAAAEAHFWQGGVLEPHRHRGAATSLLDWVERTYIERGVTRLTVKTYNRWASMLSLLLRRGYRVIAAQLDESRGDLGIRLAKELRPRRELRLSLTEVCNFRCIFCHNEGLQESQGRGASLSDTLAFLDQAIAAGYTDVTFTGGEPLLRRDRLKSLLGHLANRDAPPDVTVVTNGALLEGEIVDALAQYPRDHLKVHVSLHTADPETHRLITGTASGTFERVCGNIGTATRAGISTTINAVILHGHNHRPRQLAQLIDLTRSLRARRLKLLELLIVEANQQHARLFHEGSAVAFWMESLEGRGRKTGPRQTRFVTSGDSPLVIDVQQLTCQLGCSRCREVRDRTVDSNLMYHPCFVRTSQAFPTLPASTLERAFADGDRLIDGFAAKYGDSSPTLLKADDVVQRKGEFYLWVGQPDQQTIRDGLREILTSAGFSLVRTQVFHEEFFRPRAPGVDWRKWKRALKMASDRSNDTRVGLVYADLEYESEQLDGREYLLTRTSFLYPDGPLVMPLEKATMLLDRFDFVPFLNLDWDIETYRVRSEDGGAAISIGFSGKHATVKVPGDTEALRVAVGLLAQYKGAWGPIDRPLWELVG